MVNERERERDVARKAILAALGRRKAVTALDVLDAANAKAPKATLAQLQVALMELVAANKLRIDEQLRIARTTQAAR